MQTRFSEDQLADPRISEANRILRSCVHCGFCLATCPTYLILGDELDSPRGRIYLAKEMLESGKAATPGVVKHLDRCLTCLSCMTTCPAGVHYGHLVHSARVHIERTYRRPWRERWARQALAIVIPRPSLFRAGLLLGQIARLLLRPVRRVLPASVRRMLAALPPAIGAPSAVDRPQVFAAEGPKRRRVALHPGCAQQVLRPEINEAAVRLLTRHGCEVVVAPGSGCCGAIVAHMGKEAPAKALARANIKSWMREIETDGLDAIVFTASGCGVDIKDYGHLFRDEPAWAEPAARVAALACDISQLILDLGLQPCVRSGGERVTYHMACSMQHGLRLRTESKRLLQAAGFEVKEPAEAHICCGSAGSYAILQPELADELRTRKVAHLAATRPAIIAAGNIGCISHIAAATATPVVHTMELLDWATGGPRPPALR
jgi:glycolate oxidase iron-sulfur subunit